MIYVLRLVLCIAPTHLYMFTTVMLVPEGIWWTRSWLSSVLAVFLIGAPWTLVRSLGRLDPREVSM